MRVAAVAATLLASLLTGNLAHAQESDDGYFDLIAETGEPGTPDEPSEPAGYWECTYYEVNVVGNTRSEANGVLTFHIDAQRWKHDSNTGTFWRWARKTCTWSTDSDRVETTFEWELLRAPDPALGIDPAYDRVVRQVFPPVAELSPVGPGYVNLGMWLATTEPPPVVARAATTNTWAEVTAALRQTSFDMGNGDSVTCLGAGDPIPPGAVDSVAESPTCGYTYRDVGSSGTITITATWGVTYELSDGRTGSRPDIVLSTTVPYDIREIQTVGVGG